MTTTIRFAGQVESIARNAWRPDHVTVTLVAAETKARLTVDVPASEARGVTVGDAFAATFSVVLDAQAAAIEAGR